MSISIQFGKPYRKDNGALSLAWRGIVLDEWRSPEYPRILAIAGKPDADVRPRVQLRFKDKNKPVFQGDWAKNAFIHVYDPKGKEKQAIRKDLKSRGSDDLEPPAGPGILSCYFSFPVPKSLSKKKAEELILTNHGIKPDIDNLAKFYMDTLQNVIIPTDAEVSTLFSTKFYGRNPGVMICYFPVINKESMEMVFALSRLFKGYATAVKAVPKVSEGSRQIGF